MRNAALAGVVAVAAGVLLLTGTEDGAPRPSTTTTVARAGEPLTLRPPRDFDDVVVVGQPLGPGDGVAIAIDLAAGLQRDGTWSDDLVVETGPARSPDGRHLAVFEDDGVAIYTEGRERRDFHRMLAVGSLVSDRLVWSPDSDAVYFLAADGTDGSADRLIGVRVGRSAQTLATFNQRGFYGLAVQPRTP